MRVVAGERGGIRLTAPPDGRTRPTSDMIREALFSMLGEISGWTVLDPFAGSGALGLEALSRGAAQADFCELSAAALRALRANIERLGYADRCVVRRQDATRRMAADAAAERRYDLLLLDPPYRMLPELQETLCLHLPRITSPQGRVVVESASAAEAPRLPLETVVSRVHGDTRVTILRHA